MRGADGIIGAFKRWWAKAWANIWWLDWFVRGEVWDEGWWKEEILLSLGARNVAVCILGWIARVVFGAWRTDLVQVVGNDGGTTEWGAWGVRDRAGRTKGDIARDVFGTDGANLVQGVGIDGCMNWVGRVFLCWFWIVDDSGWEAALFRDDKLDGLETWAVMYPFPACIPTSE